MNCPNCGAVVKGSECEYCGTTFTFENKEVNMHIDEIRGDTDKLIKTFKKLGGNYVLNSYKTCVSRKTVLDI